MHSIEGALRMSDEIYAQFGFERVFGKTNGNADTDTKITKFGISFNSDGTTTFFAELEERCWQRNSHRWRAKRGTFRSIKSSCRAQNL